MKAYQFNEATGLYEGEIFEDSATLPYVGGVTTVAPPEYGAGQVPVFDAAAQQWELLPVAIVRQLILGRNQ
ncbi:hypothetical protein SAMN02745119_01056 [Trichlorobacter thiogenes]|uniref:Tail fiber assembly protein n=1 Tax=Trichlorobacter thiogenes TaxID=115783 RepID=A0A1T4LX86_9BACT|nr:hypothetical protein [Trichlorobacter thiogenes]SJZ59360.1 hypothetical protein SAMN02745119_01056 [Trichlorobacter thiogenes]